MLNILKDRYQQYIFTEKILKDLFQCCGDLRYTEQVKLKD